MVEDSTGWESLERMVLGEWPRAVQMGQYVTGFRVGPPIVT